MIGKRNSGFEIADGLLPWARQVILGSPRPVQTAVIAQASVRVRYLQPYEDASLGGGTFALDLAVERIERTERGWRIAGNGTTRPGPIELEVDEVIAATGFSTPLLDLAELGVAHRRAGAHSGADALLGERAGLRASTSPATPRRARRACASTASAARRRPCTASATTRRVMARHLAGTHLGDRASGRARRGRSRPPTCSQELTTAPELWAQKSYLARAVHGRRDVSDIVPLAHFVDAAGPDAVAVAVEMDAAGADLPGGLRPARRGDRASACSRRTCSTTSAAQEHERELRAAAMRARCAPRPCCSPLPLAGSFLLLGVPRLDVMWEHQPAHFWLVLGVGRAQLPRSASSWPRRPRRRGDARVLLVSLAFLVTSGFLALHALATPGVLLAGKNAGFQIASAIGLLVGARLRRRLGAPDSRPNAPQRSCGGARAPPRVGAAPRSSSGRLSRSERCRRSTSRSRPKRRAIRCSCSGASASSSTATRRTATDACCAVGARPSRCRGRGGLGAPRRGDAGRRRLPQLARRAGGSGTCSCSLAFALVAAASGPSGSGRARAPRSSPTSTRSGRSATREQVSVLFADLQGYTTFAERRPPDDVRAMLNDYFATVAPGDRGESGASWSRPWATRSSPSSSGAGHERRAARAGSAPPGGDRLARRPPPRLAALPRRRQLGGGAHRPRPGAWSPLLLADRRRRQHGRPGSKGEARAGEVVICGDDAAGAG